MINKKQVQLVEYLKYYDEWIIGLKEIIKQAIKDRKKIKEELLKEIRRTEK